MAATQDDRPIKVSTPLGKDVLLLERFEGVERMSAPFEFTLHMISERPNICLKELIRKPMTITVKRHDGSERYVHGLVRQMRQLHREENFIHYEAKLVPWLWFLTLSNDCRIFQKKTVPDIIAEIFGKYPFAKFKMLTGDGYERREYCVQYRESDLDFVSRLMEDEGIFYFFEQHDDQHVMVIADSQSAIKACPGQPVARYEHHPHPVQEDDLIHSWEDAQDAGTGKFSLTDYDFEKPSTSLYAESVDSQPNEVYDYPGKYDQKPEGERYTKIRLEEEEAKLRISSGRGTCRSFLPGYKFELKEHFRDKANQAYTILEVRHFTTGNAYRSDHEPFGYQNEYRSMPHSIPFRPARVTKKPIVEGTQTAVVTGKKGEEIWVDQYGRVKVQFHWDRIGKKDENSSCWIRVSQNWAGKNWGAVFLPRIGQEVIVDFLEGDPDQPIVVGRVYNAELMHPYQLPDNKTQSGIKSRSSLKGSAQNFNELRFEDKKGEELFYMHAERDQESVVERDQKVSIGRDRAERVERNDSLNVTGKRDVSVTGTSTHSALGGITLESGAASLRLMPDGSIILTGTNVLINAASSFSVVSSGPATIKGSPATLIPV